MLGLFSSVVLNIPCKNSWAATLTPSLVFFFMALTYIVLLPSSFIFILPKDPSASCPNICTRVSFVTSLTFICSPNILSARSVTLAIVVFDWSLACFSITGFSISCLLVSSSCIFLSIFFAVLVFSSPLIIEDSLTSALSSSSFSIFSSIDSTSFLESESKASIALISLAVLISVKVILVFSYWRASALPSCSIIAEYSDKAPLPSFFIYTNGFSPFALLLLYSCCSSWAVEKFSLSIR